MGNTWQNAGTAQSTATTITVDATCKNFEGTSLSALFFNFTALTSINNLENLNMANVTNISGMFRLCSSLTAIDVSSFNTAQVTNMNFLFMGCTSLTTLDLSNFNTASVEKMTQMFDGCSLLENIYVGDGWNTDAVTVSNNMFRSCSKLPNYASSKVDKTNAHTGEGGYLKLKPKTYKVTLQEGTEDAENWTVPAEAAEGATVTATYSGEKKVKSVKAVKKNTAYAANEYNEADWYNGKVVFTKQTAASVTAVTNSDTDVTWGDGWYTVSGNVTITGNVTLTADVHLILQDGATLTINGQLDSRTNGKNLNIYGQDKGDGKLNVSYSDNMNGTAIYGDWETILEIHGGEITAAAIGDTGMGLEIDHFKMYGGKLTSTSKNNPGIQFTRDFEVYGGEVVGTTNSTSYPSNGIYGINGSLIVYGGKVKATGNGINDTEYGDYGSGFGCKVQSGTTGIKFYFSDNGTTWGDGTGYGTATTAPTNRYAKAE